MTRVARFIAKWGAVVVAVELIGWALLGFLGPPLIAFIHHAGTR